jgi:DNA-binding NtrC family response regulator
MARIGLHVDNPALRMILKAMLEAAGHSVTADAPDVVFADNPARAAACAREGPTLLLATAAQIPEAVHAMTQGVYGYVFVPLQPGEAAMMIERSLALSPEPKRDPKSLTLEEAETRLILDTLRACKHNQTEAARRLGIGRNTLWRKLKRIERERE